MNHGWSLFPYFPTSDRTWSPTTADEYFPRLDTTRPFTFWVNEL